MSANDRYEYKMIKCSLGLFGLKTNKTEKELNKLAKEGWQLDEAIGNWFWGESLILRRPR